MKIDKYTAILGNTVSYPDMHSLTDNRPLASLPFDGKYRLIDFQLSSLMQALEVFMVFFVGIMFALFLTILEVVVSGA